MKKDVIRASLLFLAIWLMLVVAGRSKFFRDPGTFWHVAVGERITHEGFFDTDPYTFTFHGREWVPHQWLGEVLMSAAYRIGGFDLLLVLSTGLLAGVFAFLGKRLLDIGIHPSVVAVLMATALASGAGHFHVRPHLATIAGFAILLCLLSSVERGSRSVSILIWFVPVSWVWSNIHGGVLGGLATLAFVLTGWIVQFALGRGPLQNRRQIEQVLLTLISSVAVCCVNPYGWRLPASWLQIYQMESLPHIIMEHRPLDLQTFGWQGIVAFACVYLMVLCTLPKRAWRVTCFVPVIWFLLTATRVRHAPLFAVVALVSLAELFPHTRIAAWLVRRKNDLYAPPDGRRPDTWGFEWTAPGIFLILVSLLAAMFSPRDRTRPLWASLDAQLWPTESLPALREATATSSPPPRIFCEYHFGGFLILHLPHGLVFIDDRCELFGDQFLEEFVLTEGLIQQQKLVDPGKPLDDWQDKYGRFDFALVSTDGGFDKAFVSRLTEWRVIHRDETATLYGRTAPVK